MEIQEGFVICDSQTKQERLKTIKGIKNYTYLTIVELERKVYGRCLPSAVFELMKQYDLSYELAKEYLTYIPYLTEENYSDVVLDSIFTARKHLIDKNLFQMDSFFLTQLKKNPVTFLNVEDSSVKKSLVSFLEKYTKVYDIKEENNRYVPKVYEFSKIEEEVYFVCNQIVKLIQEGILPYRIHICNMDNEYEFLFQRAIYTYHLPFSIHEKRNILSLRIGKDFLKLCRECSTFSNVFEQLNQQSSYYKKIMDLVIEYGLEEENPMEYVSFFEKKLKEVSFIHSPFEYEISTDMSYHFTDEDYVFLVGFNLGICPKITKDDMFLNDKELEEIGRNASLERNRIEKQRIKNLIFSTKNITISYKHFTNKDIYYPSTVIKEWDLETVSKKVDYGYSLMEDRLRLGVLYTQYQKYKIIDEDLKKYDLSILNYLKYNNEYQSLPSELLKKRFETKPLKFSYSSIKTYFACPFSYYVDRILGLNEFKPNMAARMGSFSHAVLENSYKSDFDFDKSIAVYTEEFAETAKDRFYFSVMKDIVRDLIDYNRFFESQSTLSNVEQELHIEFQTEDYIFEGFIDKMLYTEIKNVVYVAIIDYKTGKDIVSLDNVEDGFHLQLPCYMMLLSKYPKFQNKEIRIIGIYLQKVNVIALDGTMDIKAQRYKSFRLQGFSTTRLEDLEMLDPMYNKSEYIQGMSILKKGGFSTYAKVIKPEEEKQLLQIVSDLLTKAGKEIRKGNFKIEPKWINGKNESCLFCKYKDICYMKYKDLVYLESKPFPKKEGKEEK